MSHQYSTIGDTVYFYFASNDTSGSGGDGATPLFDVREAGAGAGAAPLLSGTPTLLTHANYPAGCYEVAVAATVGNGFAADDVFAVFCTLAIDSQNPSGFVGSCKLTPLATQASVDNIPTVSEFNARTLLAADYFDPATDTVANVTTVGSVTSGVTVTTNNDKTGYSVSGTITTLDGLNNFDPSTDTVANVTTVATLTGHTPQTGDSFARIGSNGAGLTGIPWNASWDSEVQSEVNDALVALNLDHLLSVAAVGTDVADNSIFARLVSSSATADWDSYVNTTDSLQAIRDKQTDIETDTQNIETQIGVAGAGLTAINLPDQTMNITGNLSGSVGSVTAGVTVSTNNDKTGYSISGTVTTLDGLNDFNPATDTVVNVTNVATLTGHTPQTGDSFARIGVNGVGLSDLGGMSTAMQGEVNAEVLDVLTVDTFAQPGQEAPAATTNLMNMIRYLYKSFRNRSQQTATEYRLYADDGTTVDQKATTSDSAGTTTKGEIETGP